MIYIISAGRSGSGWLSCVLYSLGHHVTHEIHTVGEHLQAKEPVWSDTTLCERISEIVAEVGEGDKIIYLVRSQEEIEASVRKMLPGVDTSGPLGLFLKAIFQSPNMRCLRDPLFINYTDLFSVETAVELANFLDGNESQYVQHWQFFKDFRITNQKCEEDVKKLYARWKEPNSVHAD